MKSINPSTGQLIQEYEEMSGPTLEAILTRVGQASAEWQRGDLTDRVALLRNLRHVLLEERDAYADLMAEEMGKPVREGRSEVEKCATLCAYYADHGARFLEPEPVKTEAYKSYVCFQPLGVVLAIMPWNFPFWQLFRCAVPALLAGNGIVLKHASNVCGSALAIERAFARAEFPTDLLRAVFVESDHIGDVIEDERIAAVTLTGSTRAGRQVAARAGRALKKTVLELGGSDPYVVLSDADIEHASDTCVTSRLINTGQSCIAAKRFIVVSELRAQFEEAVVQRMGRVHQGDPLDPKTEIGPMARIDLRDSLHEQLEASVRQGARLLLGGTVPQRAGAWYPPSVLSDVTPGMPAYDEELFGPVATILEAENDEDALRIANDTSFGLGAALFTADRERGERLARETLQAGSCFVNTFVRSDPRLPFGGVKDSGYGRELSHFGIREFVNIKTVFVDQ